MAELKTFEMALAEDLARDPEFRRMWERTALARAVANALVKYRGERRLSQAALGRELGMSQPAIARLESGEHNPSIETLTRLSAILRITVRVEISPENLSFELTA